MNGASAGVSTGGVQADNASAHARGIVLLAAGQHRAALEAASDACQAEVADCANDSDGTLAHILAHLELPPDPACALFYEVESCVRTVSRSQVRQPINARGLGRWKTYDAELAPLIAALDPAAA